MKKARKLYESASGDRWYLIATLQGLCSSITRPIWRPEDRWNMRTLQPS